MRLRLPLVLILAFSCLTFSAGRVSAGNPPRCFGVTATQWLTSPGTLHATAGDDVFVGSNGNDLLDTYIWGGVQGGVDLFCGGGGDDEINILGAGSKADGGSGNDYISALWAVGVGGSGNDRIEAAGAGARGEGGSGNDTLYITAFGTGIGGSGNDKLTANGKNVSLFGGSGTDSLFTESDADNAILDCGSGFDSVTSTVPSATISKCEQVL